MKRDMQSDVSLDDSIKSLDFSYRGIISNKYYVIISQVICKQLGFTNGGSAHGSTTFGPGSGWIWAQNVRCQGSESHIFDCQYCGFSDDDCDNSDDVGVTCNP